MTPSYKMSSEPSTYKHQAIQPHSKIQKPPSILQITLISDPTRPLHHADGSLPPRRPAQHHKRRHSRNESVIFRVVVGSHDAAHDE